MALHPFLIKQLGDALAGKVHEGPGKIEIAQGSYNYGSMSAAAAALDADNRGDASDIWRWDEYWVNRLEEQEQIGLLAHEGPKGMQIEQGAPAPHDGMNVLPVLGVWRSARKRKNTALADLCERNIASQLRYRYEFAERGVSCPPCLRAKPKNDPSNGSGIDQWQSRLLDRLTRILMGMNIKATEPLSAEALLLELVSGPDGPSRRSRMLSNPFPKLAVPVKRAKIADDRWLAWLDVPAGLPLLDPLSWVVFGPGLAQPILGYDDKPRPEVPPGAAVRTYGAG